MNRTFNFGLLSPGPVYAKDADGNEIPDESQEEKDKRTAADQDKDKKFSQADLDRYAGNARKEAKKVVEKELLEKYGFKTTAELDTAIAAQKKAEADALSELDKEKKKATDAEKKAKDLEEANRKLTLQRKFETAVKELKLEFASPKAADDAFNALDVEKAGEDDKGMEAAIKALQEDRPYLFKEADSTSIDIDARRKGGKSTEATTTQEAIDAKRRDKDYGSI